MPVKGSLQAVNSPIVFNMYVGEKGYIHVDDISVVGEMITINLETYVHERISVDVEKDKKEEFYFIPIERIGLGLTEEDFFINLTLLSEDHIFEIEPKSFYDIDDLREQCLIFTDFDFVLITINDEQTIEFLKEALEKAKVVQDYKKMAEIQKKIKKLQKKKK